MFTYVVLKKRTLHKKTFTLQTAKIDGDLLITERNCAYATTVFSELYRVRGQN